MTRLLLLFFFGVQVGCTPAHHDLVPEVTGENESLSLPLLLDKPEFIQFADIQRIVLNKSCTQCHGEANVRDNVSVASLEYMLKGEKFRKIIVAYEPEKSPLYTSLIASGRRLMPPANKGSLTEQEIRLVYEWIAAGAKKVPEQKVEEQPTLKEQLKPYFEHPETIDYNVVQKYVFRDNCIKCHSTKSDNFREDNVKKDSVRYGPNMTSYEDMVLHVNPAFREGAPEESPLFESVAFTQSMPPAEYGYDLLDGNLIKLMRLWILNCAIEDYESLMAEDLIKNKDKPEKVRLCNP